MQSVQYELSKKMISMGGNHENWMTCVTEQQYPLIGLFLGLSGIGYNIMKFFWYEQIPSILSLESPK